MDVEIRPWYFSFMLSNAVGQRYVLKAILLRMRNSRLSQKLVRQTRPAVLDDGIPVQSSTHTD